MGIESFVQAFLTKMAPQAKVGSPPVKRPNADMLFLEIFPLLFSLPPGEALREQEAKRAALERVEMVDEHPRLAAHMSRHEIDNRGTHTMLEICKAIDHRCRDHVLSSGPEKIKFLTIVGDTRDRLPLKTATRKARLLSWLKSMRADDPRPGAEERGIDEYVYPPGSIILDGGIRLPDGRVVLIDVVRLLHSGDQIVHSFVEFIHDYLTSDGSACSSQYAVAVVDLSYHLPLVMSVGSGIKETYLPITSAAILTRLRELRSASDGDTICMIEIDRQDAGLHNAIEGDMALVQHIKKQTETLWVSEYKGVSPVLVIDTKDTDPLGVLLSLGKNHPLFRVTGKVFWYSPVSGVWDAGIVENALAHHDLDRPYLLTMFHISGTDFFEKKTLTHQIGSPTIWATFRDIDKGPLERCHPAGANALDYLVRALVANKTNLPIVPKVPDWISLSRRFKRVNPVGPQNILKCAALMGQVFNYWATCGRDTCLPAQCAEELYLYDVAHGSSTNPHNRSTLTRVGATVEETDEKTP